MDQNTGDQENHLLGRLIHSFVIKVWREDTQPGESTWRGHITHVPGNERKYLKSLGDISEFVKPYLRQMGVRVDGQWKVKQWMKWRRLI